MDGKSLLDIANLLNAQQVEYMPGIIGWNKARIMRIIEDTRYLGGEGYPAIIDTDMEYDDQIARQILECVVVESKTRIKVVFVGGLEVEEEL